MEPTHELTSLSPDESVSATIATAIATATDTDPTEVPVLQQVVDVDSLRSLVDSDPSASPLTVRFEIGDCEVVVSNDGTVQVSNRAPTPTPTPDRPIRSRRGDGVAVERPGEREAEPR